MLSKGLVATLCAALLGVTAGGLTYISHEHVNASQTAAQNKSLSDSLRETQNQVAALSQTIADLSAPKPATVARAGEAKRTAHSAAPARTSSRRRAEDPRFKQMSAEIAEQQKQLAGTRDELAGTREELGQTKAELNDRLSSTRDELSTSIAKSHDELVELEKRGERSYYEFKLDKSKNFDRIGPVRVGLRKADVKHKSFNVALMVDDNQLQKKNVNLYEPVWVNVDGEDLQMVVNQIKKDHIEGYLSEPKYRKADSRPTLKDSPQP